MALVLGVDLGTSSTKTVVLNDESQVVAMASANYPLLTAHAGWVEQNPTDWWQAVCDTIHQVIRTLTQSNPAYSVDDIKGVSVSGQMNGAVPVNSAGIPLRPAILWLDQRSRRECEEANEYAGDLFLTHAGQVLNPINTLAKVLWLHKNEPECYAAAFHVLIPKDWIRFKLTEVFASDVSDASVTAALDLYTRDWSDAILHTLKVRRNLFPRVVESPTIVGEIAKAASEETGLIAGTPVCAGGGDMACMAVGSGVIKPGIISVGIGTAGHALAFAEKIDVAGFNQLWPMCHAVPDKYFWVGCTYTGGASLKWFSDQFDDSFENLGTQAESISVGSDGLFFTPWFQGAATPQPDPHARASWIGLTLHHTKSHMIRSLMEGVVFDLRHSLECFKQLGLPINQIRIGEGGAKSALWRQIQADVFAQDLQMMKTQDASAIGAAVIAGIGVGVFESFESACERATVMGGVVAADANRVVQYERCYRQYSRLYPALKEWFRDIEA